MRDWRLLKTDSELPSAAAAPAPWTLGGDGWILLLDLPDAVRRDPRHLPGPLRGCSLGGPAIVMFVDYADSPAGPYRELLYIPGRFELDDGRHAWSITRIYVSTWDSVVNGRKNWGIPKDRADFSRSSQGGKDTLAARVGGKHIARFTLAARGPALPVSAGLLPAGLRRIVQFHGGQRFELAPGGRGRARMARASGLESDPALFPDLAAATVRLALKVEQFRLTFPVAATASQTPR